MKESKDCKRPMPPCTIELLAPAKDCATGIAAINHGADAVYIGAPRFGARAAASNTIADIRQLTVYAHQFHARVYVALNTLLNNEELQEAVTITWQLSEIGVDALIIQDMGLLECDLPSLPLHASTQCDNRTTEKVKFLEEVGFAQVVLARELSLSQIAEIRAATSVPLEFFIHGALCVSYSGRCFMSEVVAGRSANRGECAQFCRHRYTLRDREGNILKKNCHLLSLKDLDLSCHLRALIDAGISSFKIEGRLKDAGYVKNVTAFYRTALDRIIDGDERLQRASSGRCTFAFTPDPGRTFNRGGTDYFLINQKNRPGSLTTPKSMGKEIGRVRRILGNSFEIDTSEEITNGDGLCFFDTDETLVGLRVNRAQGTRIFPKDRVSLQPGTTLYRNFDIVFSRQLQKSGNCRKIAVTVTLSETSDGFGFTLEDEDSCRSFIDTPMTEERARNPEMMRNILIQQAQKSGNTIFFVEKVIVDMEQIPHLGVALINDIRRKAFDAHLQIRLQHHGIPHMPLVPNTVPWPSDLLTPAFPSNRKAQDFYARHGLITFGDAVERNRNDIVLMTCRYCLKAQLGFCPMQGKQVLRPAEPLTITDNTGTYELAFDCRRCEMTVLLRSFAHRNR
jgi:23S rRNA 5-hydroxycytidine C2501 synthase